MNVNELQSQLIEIISLILVEPDDETEMVEALEIVNQLGPNHINDDVKSDDNHRKTVLDYVVFCDTQGNVRLNNKLLIELESVIRNIGGKTSQELEQRQDEEQTSSFFDIIIQPISLVALFIGGFISWLFWSHAGRTEVPTQQHCDPLVGSNDSDHNDQCDLHFF
ncbi:MAG: hypothetical protein ACR5K9_09430 [Wolbachia sp.]